MIKVTQAIEIYEEDEMAMPIGVNKSISIESHRNSQRRVVLVVDGKRYTVIASDLEKAIENATNTGTR